MATGYVTYTNENVAARVDESKVAYLNNRRLLDALIAIKNSGGGNNWSAVASSVGTLDGSGQPDATRGQTVFDNLDAAMAGSTAAYDALSKMDKNAL